MGIGSKIYDKLIEDFSNLQFEDGTTIFNKVQKYYAKDSMEALDCLIIPVSTNEVVTGQSAGNTATTRLYAFSAIVVEQLEATDNDVAGGIKYSRLVNIADSILDYLQKEPSNLNSWGNANDISIFKIRTDFPRYEVQQTESGYAVYLDVSFTIYLNVVPQNL
jgi:hypothetical protein